MRAGLMVATALLVLAGCGKVVHRSGLRVNYGDHGIERLSFNDVVLEDLSQYPADAFHIWHLKISDGHGKVLHGKEYDWGEVNRGRTWDAATHSWRYLFVWGSIRTQFVQSHDELAIRVTEENKAASGVTLVGATIYPFVLHFPDLPNGFGDATFEHLAVKADDTAPAADYGEGKVTAVAEAGTKPLYRGFEPAGNGNNYFPIISSTAMDSMSASYPKIDRAVRPGETDTFSVVLRFAGGEADEK